MTWAPTHVDISYFPVKLQLQISILHIGTDLIPIPKPLIVFDTIVVRQFLDKYTVALHKLQCPHNKIPWTWWQDSIYL